MVTTAVRADPGAVQRLLEAEAEEIVARDQTFGLRGILPALDRVTEQ